MTTHKISSRLMHVAVVLALVMFVSHTASLAQRFDRGGGGFDRGAYRGGARTSVYGGDHNVNANVNHNYNANVYRHTNVNVDHDYNVNVHGGYGYGCCGCCYHSGWGTAAAVATTAVATAAVTAAVIGSRVDALPPACSTVVVNGFAYQHCGSAWYQPQLSAGSTTYVVVNPPQ